MIKEKEQLLEEVKALVQKSNGFIVTQYKNVSANKLAGFRSEFHKLSSQLFITKKRLFLKALEGSSVKFTRDQFNGNIAIVLVDDKFIETTKVVYNFIDESKDQLAVIGGLFEGAQCDADTLQRISVLPSQDEMRAQFLGLLEAPASQTLGVFTAILSSVISCMDQKIEKEQT
jgi:large subunit ribosomal protein L10